jgi:hypothetical protein
MKKVHKVKDYVEGNQKRKDLHWQIRNGKKYFQHEGRWWEEKYLDNFYPEMNYVKSTKGELIGKNYLL